MSSFQVPIVPPSKDGGPTSPNTPVRRLMAVRRLSHMLDSGGEGVGMIDDRSGEWESFRKTEVELKEIKNAEVRAFYEHQNEILDRYVEVDELLDSSLPKEIFDTFSSRRRPSLSGNHGLVRESWVSAENGYEGEGDGETEPLLKRENGAEEREKRKEKRESLMLNVNILINIVLLASKGGAVLLSKSISLIASFVDSALDLLSTAIIYFTAVAAGAKETKTRYPTGKKRFEPLGVLIFSVLMIASFSQVFIESVERLMDKNRSKDTAALSLFGKATMVMTIVVKGLVWWWCSSERSSGVQALVQDAKNDCYLNILSLIFPWVGEKISVPELDAIGGLILSAYIIWNWCETLLENFSNLSGRQADAEEYSRIIYLATRFKGIDEISSVVVYHHGDELVVEVDVCLPPRTLLHEAHDVGEVMQTSMEALELVSRAFLHLDYSRFNPPQHLTAEQQRVRRSTVPSSLRRSSEWRITDVTISERESGSALSSGTNTPEVQVEREREREGEEGKPGHDGGFETPRRSSSA
ncbi:hypothetical protein BDY24DRAFT_398258 [Mrakia frigida]|uniref:cation diffusion facilitator family transporter n=1 Tax=Mrakia frigida TaxID=29902 RepID=UPI003FCBFAB8